MTYYGSNEYAERYRISFKDLEGNDWRVSIQQPNWIGSVTELQGAEMPIQWEGKGDEDQTKVVLGSTGVIRMVCREVDVTNSVFTPGKLLPSYINDRRVQVLRYTYVGSDTYIWGVYWQGFIKPDVLTQDWNSAPYEIELPIVSWTAASEFFTMPMPDDPIYSTFTGQTNIAGLLRAIVVAMGCDILNIVTNKPIYEDFNGEEHLVPVPGTSDPVEYWPAHWTQGVVSSAYYYENSGEGLQPKTFKDVWENILYPYGKILEAENAMYVLMYWKNDAANNAKLYNIRIWSDYQNRVMSYAVRFGEWSDICHHNLSNIAIAGTDNRYSIIPKPSSVKFTKNPDTSKEIFELTDKYIKPSLPIGSTITGNSHIEKAENIASGYSRYLYAIDKQYVNTGFATDWRIAGPTADLTNCAFCRVVAVTGETDDANYSVEVPLGFCFNVNSTGSSVTQSVAFTLNNGIRTRTGANVIKLTMKSYRIDEKDMFPGAEGLSLGIEIHDLTVNKWLSYVNNTWSWSDSEASVGIRDFEETDEGFVLLFNEYRESDDNSLHQLSFYIVGATDYSLQDNTYGRMFTTFKLEYAPNKNATYQGIASTFAESIERNGSVTEIGGNGEEIAIQFKTQAGTKNIVINGTIMLPFNSFCNAQTYIDTQNREKIEIDAARFERYRGTNRDYDFVSEYVVVNDGTKVYIPTAVGMNPRMNTVQLRLISTNVTSS